MVDEDVHAAKGKLHEHKNYQHYLFLFVVVLLLGAKFLELVVLLEFHECSVESPFKHLIINHHRVKDLLD